MKAPEYDWKKIYALYLESELTLAEFCRQSDLSYASAVAGFKRNNLKIENRGKGPREQTPAQKQAIELFKNGLCYACIAKQVTISRQSVWNTLAPLGLKRAHGCSNVQNKPKNTT